MAITVVARKGESVESLYARFKKKCKVEKLFLQIANKQFYVKPSEKRRKQSKMKK